MNSYENLGKIFYKYHSIYKQIYHDRFNSPTTKHFEFCIKQFEHKKTFSAFLCYSEESILLMEKIYKNYEGFTKTIKDVPPIVLEQFSLWCVVDEIKSSNEIEGVYSTRRELSEVLQGVSDSQRFSSIVAKYYALSCGEKFQFQTCRDVRNFYDSFIREEVSKIESNCNLDGQIFRKDSVDIKTGTGKTIHRGIYPEEKIISAMEIALKLLNDKGIPLLIRVAVSHYLFGYIHSFYDGNGRTARFIAPYFLAEHFHYLPALRLSVAIKRSPKKYYSLFRDTTAELNCGDLTPFVFGFLEMFSETFVEVQTLLKRKLVQLSKYREILKPLTPQDDLSQKIYEILLQSSSFFGQGVSMEELIRLTGKSRNTIKDRLNCSTNSHIVVTGSKKKFYKLNFSILLS